MDNSKGLAQVGVSLLQVPLVGTGHVSKLFESTLGLGDLPIAPEE